MSSATQRSLAPLERFLAIFLTAWAVVLAWLGFTRSGWAMAIFLIGAVVCLAIGLYCFRSFAFARKREF